MKNEYGLLFFVLKVIRNFPFVLLQLGQTRWPMVFFKIIFQKKTITTAARIPTMLILFSMNRFAIEVENECDCRRLDQIVCVELFTCEQRQYRLCGTFNPFCD